ncbi:hypothetical protein Dcar01_01282 [Deinococcus carri]|uniref:Putative restriction endonuclease domain-containing protein n=1 Tax=Deinococcus carri TaxID=1211323 RepID=A0ABP9W5D5_9DEIO
MSDPVLRKISEEEYLRTEETSPVKREYVDGFVYAQAGASLPHNRIATNIQAVLIPATRSRGCWSYASDMKVQVSSPGRLRYYYPDIVVICEPHEDLRQAETRPCLVVEILSQSTRQVDLTYKAQDYLSLPSLQGYLLVDSENRAAELYKRLPQGWTVDIVQDEVTLPCLDIPLSLDDIYAGVTL